MFQGEEIRPMWRGVRNGLEASEEHTGPWDTPKSGTELRKTRKDHGLSCFKQGADMFPLVLQPLCRHRLESKIQEVRLNEWDVAGTRVTALRGELWSLGMCFKLAEGGD